MIEGVLLEKISFRLDLFYCMWCKRRENKFFLFFELVSDIFKWVVGFVNFFYLMVWKIMLFYILERYRIDV